METTKPNKGDLLIAEPSILGDISFNRSVILLAEYNSKGSVGFIVNKPLEYSINDLIPSVKSKFRVYNGGPVEQNNLYFIHNVPELINDSVEISNGIYWGGDFDSTVEIINQGKIKRNNIRFFLGYTGWEKDQLDQEIKENAWIIVNNRFQKKLLSKGVSNLWKDHIKAQGGNYILFSNSPENPILN